MEMTDIKKKSDADLQKVAGELREELRVMRFETANLQRKDVREIRESRTALSRVMTELSARKKTNQAA